ncbi:MAG: cytochrome P450 [Rhodobacteraceae bacterium]|nr:cytochrome P450 [Paracoccaceae bacterium]
MKSFKQSPRDFRFVQSPYGFYRRALQQGDLFHWENYDRICAVSWRAVNFFLRDRRWGREDQSGQSQQYGSHLEPFMRLERNSMLELDQPRHTRLRNLVSRAFTSRSIAALRPDIECIAANILDELGAGTIELQRGFGERLPVLVITRLLGIAEDMADQLLAWSHDMVTMYQARRNHATELQAATAASDFSDFMNDEFNRRLRRPGDDLISRLLVVETEGQRLTRDEMISTCILLLNAGHEATAYTIGNGIKTIVESRLPPCQVFAAENVAGAVEEILRFDPPLHMFERHCKEDMEAFGHRFRRGDLVAVLLAAANRDPAHVSDPESFDPMRKPVANASFGAGIHFCVGAPLARMELAVALPAVFRRHPKLAFAEPPRYADRYHFHGLERLLVTTD